jgi:hypothetical protein
VIHGIVIVHGPMASGKTRNATRLAEKFACKRIVDGWHGRSLIGLRDGDLVLTNDAPFAVPGARWISIDDALRERCDA